MRTITSRPVKTDKLSTAETMKLCTPAINTVNWISRTIRYPDDSKASMNNAYLIICEVLDCQELSDYVVMVAPSPSRTEMWYDIAVCPCAGAPYMSFKAMFRAN